MNNFIKIILRYIYNKQYFLWVTTRTFFWSRLFKTFGNDSFVFGKITVFYPEKISIGKGAIINDSVLLNARAAIVIGNNVHLSPRVILNTSGLVLEQDPQNRTHFQKKIGIKDGTWIGANAVILPGVTIGKNSVVAAGAVVTCDIPDGEIWGGVPAKFIKKMPAFEKKARQQL